MNLRVLTVTAKQMKANTSSLVKLELANTVEPSSLKVEQSF